MGIIPLFLIGAKLTPLFYGKIYFNQKDKSRIKVFEPFEDSFKHSSMINAILIIYACVFKWSSKPVMQGSRVESIEKERNEYKKMIGKYFT